MVTVRDILKLPSLSDCTVIAGLSGLYREVHGWSIVESIDFPRWVAGGEFLITMMSFVPCPQAESDVSEWVRALITSGAVALGIKRSVYNGEIPKFLLELGDWNSFPIIEMSDSLPLHRVGLDIFRSILSEESRGLLRAIDAFSMFTASTVAGRIPDFVENLASILGNPVILETPYLNLVSVNARLSPLESKVVAARREHQCLYELQAKLNSGQDLETDSKWALPYIRHEFAVSADRHTQLTFPVKVGIRLDGYISVLQVNKKLDSYDFMILRVAINVAALIALKDATFGIQEEKFQELFKAIIDPEREREAESRAKQYGFDTWTPAFFAIAKSEEPMDDTIFKRIMDGVQRIDSTALVVRDDASIVILCHDFHDAAAKKQHITLCNYADRLMYITNVIEKQSPKPFPLLGAGRSGIGISQLRYSFDEAMETLRIAERFGVNGIELQLSEHIIKANYYGLLDIIMQDKSKAALFCKDIMGPLSDSNIKHKQDYYDTLEAYLRHGRNLADTSRHTGLHRNTITYRIEKIREILNADLNDIQTGLSIWIALQLMKRLDNEIIS